MGGGGGAPKGLGHNLLMQFSGLCRSRMEISETDFFLYIDHSPGASLRDEIFFFFAKDSP